MDYSKFVSSFGRIDRMHKGRYSSHDLLWTIATDCVSFLGLEDFIIYTFEPNKRELSQKAGYGFKKQKDNRLTDPLKVSLGEGIVGDTARKMTFQLVKNTNEDKRYIQDGHRNESELSVPIIWEGELLGVLDSEHPSKFYYTDTHIDIFYMIASFLGPRLAKSKTKRPQFTKENSYYCQFIELLESKHLYRNDQFTLDTVADLFQINRSYLSRIINQASDKKFTDIVNAYRVEDVKRAFEAQKHLKYTIMSLAYDAGFSSKSRFNAVFKKATGLTPSQYILKK